MKDLEKKIIQWNIKHPLDRSFRQKHNISLFSEEHRNVNQFDILADYVEDTLFEKIYSNSDKSNKVKKEEKAESDLFDKMKIPNE